MKNNLAKLNLGSGGEYIKGYLNLDNNKQIKADVYYDLEKLPYPFKKNEFDFILAKDILEHLEDFKKTMIELYRILKKRGRIKIIVPHYSSWYFKKDPTHKSSFSYYTFDFLDGRIGFPKFKIIKRKLRFSPKKKRMLDVLLNKKPNIYERFFSGIIPCSEIQVELEK